MEKLARELRARAPAGNVGRRMRSGGAKVVVLVALGLGPVVGCGGGTSATPGPAARPAPRPAPGGKGASVRPALPARRITAVPPGTFGPYLGARSEGVVVVWGEAPEGAERRWVSVALDAAFAPQAEPVVVADAPAEIDLVAVRPLSIGASASFVLLQTSRDFSGARLAAVALELDGRRRGGPAILAQSLPGVVWIDAVPTRTGGLALWAVPNEGSADLFAVPLGPNGEPSASPQKVMGDVTAWQVAGMDDGAAVAGVMAGKARGEPGPVTLVLVDAAGTPGSRAMVSDQATADADLDMIRLGSQLVFAWSDRRDLEPRIFGAATDLSGRVTRPPAALVPPLGPQALLRLVPPLGERKAAYLAWENTVERSSTSRAVRVAPLSEGGVDVGRVATLDLAALDGTVPELAASPGGLAAVTLAPACFKAGGCLDPEGTPTYVSFDADLQVTASEPMRLESTGGRLADLVWGLTCAAEGCMSLSAASGSPAPVYSVSLGPLSGDWVPAARGRAQATLPRVEALSTLGASDEVADLAAVALPEGPEPLDVRLSWVTYFDPATPFARSKKAAPDGKYEAPRAVIRVRDVGSAAKGPETVISYRADSRGGVALAPSSGRETLLAWAGIDAKVPQVFLTLVGPDTKKTAQKMLTRTRGGVADVTTAFVGDGWLVAWVDQSGGAARAMVAKVDRTLRAVVAERPLGRAPALESDVALLVRGTGPEAEVVVAWSAAAGEAAAADIVVTRLSARDLSPLTKDPVVVQTPGHSTSPRLALRGDEIVLLWVEDGPAGATSASSLGFAALAVDAGGGLRAGDVTAVAVSGSVQAASLTCDAAACRLGASVASEPGGHVAVCEWSGGAPSSGVELVRLESRSGDAVAPLFVPGGLVYADVVPGTGSDRGRVRRLGVTFK